MENVNKLLEEYEKLKEVIKDAKTQQNFIKSQLKIIMDRDKVDYLEGEKTYAKIQSRTTNTLDKKKIKEILKEDYDKYVNTKTSSFIIVKDKDVTEKKD